MGTDFLCQPLLTAQVPAILDAVFEPTLNMINQEFSEYPEHRAGFYKLIRAININCFPGMTRLLWTDAWISFYVPALLTIPPAQFRLFMDSIIWGIKHTMRDIADLGLNRKFTLSATPSNPQRRIQLPSSSSTTSPLAMLPYPTHSSARST
jgi:hypothetical protein